MGFFKICQCGAKIDSERPYSFPEECPACGRSLMEIETYNEKDPQAQALLQQIGQKDSQKKIQKTRDREELQNGSFFLRFPDGRRISLPPEGGIVGRDGLGDDLLGCFPSVSRKHLRISPRMGGLLIEDLSTYGTWLNGKKLEKNMPAAAQAGDRLGLTVLELILDKEEK